MTANLARIFEAAETSSAGAEGRVLGPAVVTAVRPGELSVRLEDGSDVSATLALALPYVATADDVVLVIGEGGRYWVIGVVEGKGQTQLAFQGDVAVRAVGGTLDLAGDAGVRVRGQDVSLDARKLRITAGDVVEKVESLYQRVRDVFSVRAKHQHVAVEESSMTKAKSATILTEETMTINGKQIHLG